MRWPIFTPAAILVLFIIMVQASVLDEFFARSSMFYGKHSRPISSSTALEVLVRSKRISEYDAAKYIQTNRILVHATARSIARSFLDHKKLSGTKTEKAIYSQLDWNTERFIVRLIKQRPLCFWGPDDTTLLRDGRRIASAKDEWDHVGSDHEHQSIQMQHYLSYEEMMISSLLGVSGYTAFLNDGNRSNRGVVDFEKAQREGIQIGLVGARFEREGRMDSIYLPDQAESHSFIASMFPGQTFEQRYKSRIRIPIETMLMEAEIRGAAVKRKTWVNVVGLGLGVWQVTSDQKRWYIEGFAEAIACLRLDHIDTLEFAWINVDDHTKQHVEAAAAKPGIRTIWSKRSPSARLTDQSLLLVTTYAWDGNSYPGNEFYMGMLDASGDPAAAASSLISETQNPEINNALLRSLVYLP